MYITVSNHKGGVGKTTTAVHLAAYLQTIGRTVLIDGDPNRSASEWAKSGKFPFTVVDISEGAYQARNFEHVVIDTEASPGQPHPETLARAARMAGLWGGRKGNSRKGGHQCRSRVASFQGSSPKRNHRPSMREQKALFSLSPLAGRRGSAATRISNRALS